MGRANQSAVRVVVAAAVSLCFVVLSMAAPMSGADDDYSLYISVDDTKVGIVSGNLTAAVTRDWPRIVYWHSEDPFTPTFEVSFPRMFMFNDTDADGVFARSEMLGVSFLDSNHVLWNFSAVDQGFSTSMGAFARFNMTTHLSIYRSLEDETVTLSDWAIVTFGFCIAENDVTYENAAGSYVVDGKVSLSVDVSLDVLRQVNSTCIVLEQRVEGGGSASMFVIDDAGGQVEASGLIDEREFGENYTHQMVNADGPLQRVSVAKDDGTVQAIYEWASLASCNRSSNTTQLVPATSYYTDGIGLTIDTAFAAVEDGATIAFGGVIGLDEGGFVGRMRDWVMEYLPWVAVSVAVVTAMVALFAWRVKTKRGRTEGPKQ